MSPNSWYLTLAYIITWIQIIHEFHFYCACRPGRLTNLDKCSTWSVEKCSHFLISWETKKHTRPWIISRQWQIEQKNNKYQQLDPFPSLIPVIYRITHIDSWYFMVPFSSIQLPSKKHRQRRLEVDQTITMSCPAAVDVAFCAFHRAGPFGDKKMVPFFFVVAIWYHSLEN